MSGLGSWQFVVLGLSPLTFHGNCTVQVALLWQLVVAMYQGPRGPRPSMSRKVSWATPENMTKKLEPQATWSSARSQTNGLYRGLYIQELLKVYNRWLVDMVEDDPRTQNKAHGPPCFTLELLPQPKPLPNHFPLSIYLEKQHVDHLSLKSPKHDFTMVLGHGLFMVKTRAPKLRELSLKLSDSKPRHVNSNINNWMDLLCPTSLLLLPVPMAILLSCGFLVWLVWLKVCPSIYLNLTLLTQTIDLNIVWSKWRKSFPEPQWTEVPWYFFTCITSKSSSVAEYAWLDKSMDTSEKITVLDCSNALAFLI